MLLHFSVANLQQFPDITKGYDYFFHTHQQKGKTAKSLNHVGNHRICWIISKIHFQKKILKYNYISTPKSATH